MQGAPRWRCRPGPASMLIRAKGRYDMTGSTSVEPSDSADERHLAKLGYRQELTRTLGQFSTFATGFAFISVLTGILQLFFFGFASAGPAFWWVALITVAGAGLF